MTRGFMALAFMVSVGCSTKDLSQTPFPQVQARDEADAVVRGEYLFHAVVACSSCHTDKANAERRVLGARDDASGGRAFDVGPVGTFYAPNVSGDRETGVGAWSDAELARTLRHAVGRDGRLALFMYFNVGPMADEDLAAVIAYMRTLPPKKNVVPRDDWGLMGKLLIGGTEARADPPPAWVPPDEVSAERGRYLANGPAACWNCHTSHDPMKGFAEIGARFSGDATPYRDETDDAFEFVSPNLTSAPKTGIMTSWSEDAFVERFRKGRVYAGSTMPWQSYALMTEGDLRSLYRYFTSLPPTERLVGPPRRPTDWKPAD